MHAGRLWQGACDGGWVVPSVAWAQQRGQATHPVAPLLPVDGCRWCGLAWTESGRSARRWGGARARPAGALVRCTHGLVSHVPRCLLRHPNPIQASEPCHAGCPHPTPQLRAALQLPDGTVPGFMKVRLMREPGCVGCFVVGWSTAVRKQGCVCHVAAPMSHRLFPRYRPPQVCDCLVSSGGGGGAKFAGMIMGELHGGWVGGRGARGSAHSIETGAPELEQAAARGMLADLHEAMASLARAAHDAPAPLPARPQVLRCTSECSRPSFTTSTMVGGAHARRHCRRRLCRRAGLPPPLLLRPRPCPATPACCGAGDAVSGVVPPSLHRSPSLHPP